MEYKMSRDSASQTPEHGCVCMFPGMKIFMTVK